MRNQKLITFAAFVMVSFCACSESTAPNNQITLDTSLFTIGRFAGKAYDTAKGGLQVARIYFDQDSNMFGGGNHDEWIILLTDRVMYTKGWTLWAGDFGQYYELPDTIYKTLRVYTHNVFFGQDTLKNYGLNESGGTWIWNNTGPDSASLRPPGGSVVDVLRYN